MRRLSVPRHAVASPGALQEAEGYLALELDAAGLRVERQLFRWRGREYHNVLGTLDGSDPARPWVIVGAHFDSVAGSPGADDNASGVAALLEIARLLGGRPLSATVQLVGFNLEEVQELVPPIYRIGSRAYVEWLKKREVGGVGTVGRVGVVGALVLEMVGFTGSRQHAPAGVRLFKRVPREGTFLGAVGDGKSRSLLAVLERAAEGVLPLVTLAVPLKGWLVPDVRRSDNSRFWDEGIPALMLTDTAEFRNPHYHQASDTPETLDYEFMGRVVETVWRAVKELAG